MSKQVSIPKGTRDFLPAEMMRRNYIFRIIRNTFEQYGYAPIETPAMENLSTLMGKYGEEGDKLLFKILNSGNFLEKANVSEADYHKWISFISEKGLRYDLTVPFARFVVQHRQNLTFPFKRYQIQPVWRADRPQKGRYREFYQCDADVIGSKSLLNEIELLQIADDIFSRLKIEVTIKLNNRKILFGIAETIGYPEKMIDITIAIDKLEKIGIENVEKELLEKGISHEAIQKLQPVFNLSGSNIEKIDSLKPYLSTSEIGLKGIEEMKEILEYLQTIHLNNTIELDLTLARGLNYYTGSIIEVKANNKTIGSISGGGRYDDLTGVFGVSDISGVGISFGADRIYDVLAEDNLFPSFEESTMDVLFVNFGKKESVYLLPIIQRLRKQGIKAEIYPDAVKLGKQFGYADTQRIPMVVIAGENEINNQTLQLKNMFTGEQSVLSEESLMEILLKIKSNE